MPELPNLRAPNEHYSQDEHPCPVCGRPGKIYKDPSDSRPGYTIAHAFRPYVPCRYVPPPSGFDYTAVPAAKAAYDRLSAFFDAVREKDVPDA